MGRTFRRVTEAVRQMFGSVPDEHFHATSNARNEAMLKEASDFSLHLRTLEKDLRCMERQMTVQFQNMRSMLVTPLPKVYDRAPDGEAWDVVALEHPDHATSDGTIGNRFDCSRLELALSDLKVRLDEQVYQPMHEWTKEFKRVQAEMKVLEALRLELDSRKRTVVVLDKKLAMQRDRTMARTQAASAAPPGMAAAAPLHAFGSARHGGSGALDAKLEEELERIERVKKGKEEKRGDNEERFNQLEHDVFRVLEALVLRATQLRVHASTALLHVQDCFTTAISAFNSPVGLDPQQQQQQQQQGDSDATAAALAVAAQQQQLLQQAAQPAVLKAAAQPSSGRPVRQVYAHGF